MSAQPVFPHLQNSYLNNLGFEYYSASNKALSIVRLFNSEINKTETFGFLFSEVTSVTQKIKNKKNLHLAGGLDVGMLHFLYVVNGINKTFYFHSERFLIGVKANSVELIKGLQYA